MSFGNKLLGFGAFPNRAPAITEITLSSNTTNYSLAADLQNNYGWPGNVAIEVVLTINSSVNVFSTNPSTPAILVNLVSGSVLTINNNGNIIGRGGSGGDGASAGTLSTAGSAGTAGGNAINLENVTATINNASGAVIGGGGGGGGGEGNARGRPINDAESGCTGTDIENAGGNGGSGASQDSPPSNSASSGSGGGGAGGTWGNAGSGGGSGSLSGIDSGCDQFRGGGGNGGAAGKAISVGSNASRTLNNSGTVHGATS